MEDPEFTVVLTGTAYSGPAALRAIRMVTGLSLWHSRRLLDSAPATAQAEVPYESAAAALKHLRQAGVQAAIRCEYCERTLPTDGAPRRPRPVHVPVLAHRPLPGQLRHRLRPRPLPHPRPQLAPPIEAVPQRVAGR